VFRRAGGWFQPGRRKGVNVKRVARKGQWDVEGRHAGGARRLPGEKKVGAKRKGGGQHLSEKKEPWPRGFWKGKKKKGGGRKRGDIHARAWGGWVWPTCLIVSLPRGWPREKGIWRRFQGKDVKTERVETRSWVEQPSRGGTGKGKKDKQSFAGGTAGAQNQKYPTRPGGAFRVKNVKMCPGGIQTPQVGNKKGASNIFPKKKTSLGGQFRKGKYLALKRK